MQLMYTSTAIVPSRDHSLPWSHATIYRWQREKRPRETGGGRERGWVVGRRDGGGGRGTEPVALRLYSIASRPSAIQRIASPRSMIEASRALLVTPPGTSYEQTAIVLCGLGQQLSPALSKSGQTSWAPAQCP